jgi:beta-glucosidase
MVAPAQARCRSSTTTSLLDGLKESGFQANPSLTKLYTDYRKDRPVVGMFAQDWTLPEVPAAQYSDSLMQSAKDYSDEAVVVITRVGGEGADLPENMRAKGITYHDNSKDYPDFQNGEHFLQLSQTEKDMLNLVTKNFNKVTLVYNGANTFQLDFVNSYPQIRSVLWCPPAGQTGFTALGGVLAGSVNPSGKTSDTFIKDLKKSVSYNNFGYFAYKNADEFAQSVTGFTGKTTNVTPTFVNYSEGIYVGYKFYETAAKEGLINYADTVLYPFGYGLSYTSFEQKMGDITHDHGKVSFDVTVTNTGKATGKDVVEVYYDPPYTDGGIEKAATNLVTFEKTKKLKPGESQSLSVAFKDSDMASYDQKGAKAWVRAITAFPSNPIRTRYLLPRRWQSPTPSHTTPKTTRTMATRRLRPTSSTMRKATSIICPAPGISPTMLLRRLLRPTST